MATNQEFRALVQNVLARRGVSPLTLAQDAGLNRDAIRSVLRGRAPSLERAADVCKALGLVLRIEPRQDLQPDDPDSPDHAKAHRCPPTDFTDEVELSVREWPRAAPEGVWAAPGESAPVRKAPAPVHCSDPAAFYAITGSDALSPLHITRSDSCLVSPNASIQAPQRVWLKDDQGRQTILCLIRMTDDSYELVGWGPPNPDRRPQEMFAVHLKRTKIVDRGAVVAVYRTTPSLTSHTNRASHWPPPPLRDLWT